MNQLQSQFEQLIYQIILFCICGYGWNIIFPITITTKRGIMNHSSVTKRTIFPQTLPREDVDPRKSRSKIEMTHLQQGYMGADRSNYSVVTRQTPQVQSAHRDVPSRQEISHKSDDPLGNVEMNSRLLALMKEQIDIAACNFREKMGQQIRQQAKEIQKLNVMIAYNEQTIQRQLELIARAGVSEDFMTSTSRSRLTGRSELRNTSKSPRKISLTQNRSLKKIGTLKAGTIQIGRDDVVQRDQVNLKIQALRASLDEIEEKLFLANDHRKEMIGKVGGMQRLLGGHMWKTIKKCDQILQKHLKVNDNRLNSDKLRELISSVGIMGDQVRQLRELMFNLANRQFTYDSYQLNTLKTQLSDIGHKVAGLSKNPHTGKIKKVHEKGATNRLLNHSQTLPNENMFFTDRVQRPNLSLLDQTSSNNFNTPNSQPFLELQSDEDQFFFQDPRSARMEREQLLAHLQGIMTKNKCKFPVRVQIDGTGYLKEYTTGMYILDEYDNGFELTLEEIQFLKVKGVITM